MPHESNEKKKTEQKPVICMCLFDVTFVSPINFGM